MDTINKIRINSFYDELIKLSSLFNFKKKPIVSQTNTIKPTKIKFNFGGAFEEDDIADALEDELAKFSGDKGRRYPSKEMKKEYDAANDNIHEDLDAATAYSPHYPVSEDAAMLKRADLKPGKAYYFIGKRVDGKLMFNPEEWPGEEPVATPKVGYRPPETDISHGDGSVRSYDFGMNS